MTNDRFRSAAIATRGAATRDRVSHWDAGRAPLPQRLKRLVAPIGAHVLHSPLGNPFTYVAHRDDAIARGIVWEDLASSERNTVVELCERSHRARSIVTILDENVEAHRSGRVPKRPALDFFQLDVDPQDQMSSALRQW